MTALATTYTLDYRDPVHLEGDKYLVTGTINFNAGAGVVGGHSIVPATFGLDQFISFMVASQTSILGHHANFVLGASYILGKVILFIDDTTSGVEVAETTADFAAAQTIDFIAIGRKAA